MFKQIWKLVALLMVISMVLAACATPAAAPATPIVVTQIVNGQPVVVTATPEATANPVR